MTNLAGQIPLLKPPRELTAPSGHRSAMIQPKATKPEREIRSGCFVFISHLHGDAS
jgi:hypothetical protein